MFFFRDSCVTKVFEFEGMHDQSFSTDERTHKGGFHFPLSAFGQDATRLSTNHILKEAYCMAVLYYNYCSVDTHTVVLDGGI